MGVNDPTAGPALDHVIRRLVSDGEKTAEFFRGLPPEAWEQQVYMTGGRWSVRMVLAHFVFAERALYRLIADVAAGGPGAPRDLDIDRFNEAEAAPFRSTPPLELLEAFRDARAATVRLAGGLGLPDLPKRGYHPWFGDVELGEMLKLVYRHNMIHLRDIRVAIETGAPVAHRDITPPSKVA